MLVALAQMNSVIGDFEGNRARILAFAGAYVTAQLARSVFTMVSLKDASPANYRNFQRITIWLACSGAFWIAGGLSEGPVRFTLWLIALGIEYVGPAFYLLGNLLFKRTTAGWYPLSHLVGLALLALLVPAWAVLPPLGFSLGATAILILVAAWEAISLRPTEA